MYLIYSFKRRSQAKQVLKQSEAALPLLRTHGERPIIDLQDLPESIQNARALEAYDRISTGDALEIVSTRRPGHLFAEFRARYGSGFYWWPLENRPGVWRVMVAKPAAEPATTVAGVMGADHHRLHDLWRDFVRDVEIRRIDDLSRCLWRVRTRAAPPYRDRRSYAISASRGSD